MERGAVSAPFYCLFLMFHHACRGGINAFFSPVDRDPKAYAPGQRNPAADYARDPDAVMHRHMVFPDDIHDEFVHSLPREMTFIAMSAAPRGAIAVSGDNGTGGRSLVNTFSLILPRIKSPIMQIVVAISWYTVYPCHRDSTCRAINRAGFTRFIEPPARVGHS